MNQAGGSSLKDHQTLAATCFAEACFGKACAKCKALVCGLWASGSCADDEQDLDTLLQTVLSVVWLPVSEDDISQSVTADIKCSASRSRPQFSEQQLCPASLHPTW